MKYLITITCSDCKAVIGQVIINEDDGAGYTGYCNECGGQAHSEVDVLQSGVLMVWDTTV